MLDHHCVRPIILLFALAGVAGCSGDDVAAPASHSPALAMIATESVAESDGLGATEVASANLSAAMDSESRAPMAALAVSYTSENCDAFLTQPANVDGSQLYQEVKLATRTAWPSPDNITLSSGGRAVSARGAVESSTVGPVNIVGASYAFYTWDDSYLRDLYISNFKVTESRREGIRLRGDVAGVTIRNFSIRMRDEPQSGSNLPEGIKINDGEDILIEDGCTSGFKMVEVEGEYTNGDGIAAERPVNNLTIRRVWANDNSDAGFDLKSNNTYLYDTRAERNFRNYRFWTKATTGTIYSADPGQAHVWIGAGAEVVIDKLIAKSSTDIYVLWADYAAKSITIRSCELDVPNAKKFFRGSSSTKLVLGPGCSLDGDKVVENSSRKSSSPRAPSPALSLSISSYTANSGT
jgi:hypothetical protein